MFRPLINTARRTAVQASRRHASSSSHGEATIGGDTKWLMGAVAVTVPSLAYLLSPPEKKASAHKAAHAAAASAGLHPTASSAEEAAAKIPDAVHGPSSRTDREAQGTSQTPASQRDQAASQPGSSNSGSAKAGNAITRLEGERKDGGEGREAGVTSPTGGDIGSKQSGLSNTQTKHMVPAVIKDGENPVAKSQNTIDPHAPRGQEKDGRKAASSSDDETTDQEAPKSEGEESD
ncbi:hypothetical protein PYCC9005_001169 [Savitreella phatthalungensis]